MATEDKKTWLVTGGTGFLGQHLVRQLLKEDGADVVILARSKDRGLARLGARFHTGSVLDGRDVREAMAGVDGVYHLAGKVERHLERSHTLYTLHVNGTRNVLEAAAEAGVKRVVVASTSGTVGVTEDGHTIPNDRSPHATEVVKDWPYYLSKVYAEKTALSVAERLGVEVVLMRPTLLLGPGDDRLSSTKDVLLFLDGKVPFTPSGGLSFVDVRDTAQAFRAAMERGRPGASYLLGSANMTMEAFFERLSNISGQARPLITVPDRVARVGARLMDAFLSGLGRTSDLDPVSVAMSQHFWYIDWSAAIDDLGWSPRDPGQTLYDTVQWLRANGRAAEQRAERDEREPSPFAPTTRWEEEEDAPYNDAAFARPTTDAWGEPVARPRPVSRPPTEHVGQSRILNEDYSTDGPGLESLVGGLVGGALSGLLQRRREPSSPTPQHRPPQRTDDLRAELVDRLKDADEAEIRRLLELVGKG